jgi:microcystin-dependent protein
MNNPNQGGQQGGQQKPGQQQQGGQQGGGQQGGGQQGGGQPHNNVQPFVALTFIISLFGIYPSRP